MNSVESLKGFLSFLILLAIILVTVTGFNYAVNRTSLQILTEASDEDVIPTEITTKKITPTEAEIIWLTKIPLKGSVLFSEEKITNSCNLPSCNETYENIETDTHYIKLDTLKPNTTYYYKIRSNGTIYPPESFLSFTTENGSSVAKVDRIEVKSPIEEETPSENKKDDFPEETTDTNTNIQSEVVAPDGYYNENGLQEGPYNTSDREKVLGSSTDVLNEQIVEEYKIALQNQDLKYDFNRDGLVSSLDYPLFLYFISNPEE